MDCDECKPTIGYYAHTSCYRLEQAIKQTELISSICQNEIDLLRGHVERINSNYEQYIRTIESYRENMIANESGYLHTSLKNIDHWRAEKLELIGKLYGIDN